MTELDFGKVTVKNVSGSDYVVEELGGHTISDQEVINLLDQELPSHYDEWEAANRMVTSGNSKLRQDIVSGEVELIESVPPFLR